MTVRELPKRDDAMLIARRIVEAHINTWGYIPHPDYLKESIAASLAKAANTGTLSWSVAGDGERASPSEVGK